MSDENVRKNKKGFGHLGHKNNKCPKCPKNVRRYRATKRRDISTV